MAPQKVTIYASADTPRLSYIAGIILGDILGLSWEIITDRSRIEGSPVINYSGENIQGSFRISPVPLLFEKVVERKKIFVSRWNKLPVFFQTTSDSDIPFDIFAASFYMVSRYEEYLEHQPDEHGRFRASSTLAFREGFLDKPVVDLWARELARLLLGKYPSLIFRKNQYNSLLTIDSDQPFAYLGKNLFVNIGGMIREATGNNTHATDRYNVLLRGRKDPYQVYDYILGNIEKYNTPAKFFFPTGNYSRFDKNPSWKSRSYKSLIDLIGSRFAIGIHPSYYAAGNVRRLKKEIGRLESVTGYQITLSRYHYLRISIPSSFRAVSELGITEEYSLGFPDEPGFRAGIARPFYFYDVAADTLTGLKIIPFQVMDGTLYDYKKLDPDSAEEIIVKLIEATKSAGGLFVSIWHNTSLLEIPRWKGWRMLFEKMLKKQQP